MTNADFTITRVSQDAADFGKEYFENGYSRQIVYNVYQNGKLIKQTISTKFEENLFAYIIIGNKAENGIEILPLTEIVYDVRFSKNGNKKFGFGVKTIVMQTTS